MTSPDAASSITELVAYRLQRATFYAAKPGHLAFARKFGITGVEWRLMGTISLFAPIAMLPLAEEADVQLAQAHRTITTLAERGLVRCEGDVNDRRKVLVSLTPAGKTLYRKAFAEASQRNRRLLTTLSDKECLALFAMLDKIAAEGRVMLDEERKAAA